MEIAIHCASDVVLESERLVCCFIDLSVLLGSGGDNDGGCDVCGVVIGITAVGGRDDNIISCWQVHDTGAGCGSSGNGYRGAKRCSSP